MPTHLIGGKEYHDIGRLFSSDSFRLKIEARVGKERAVDTAAAVVVTSRAADVASAVVVTLEALPSVASMASPSIASDGVAVVVYHFDVAILYRESTSHSVSISAGRCSSVNTY